MPATPQLLSTRPTAARRPPPPSSGCPSRLPAPWNLFGILGAPPRETSRPGGLSLPPRRSFEGPPIRCSDRLGRGEELSRAVSAWPVSLSLGGDWAGEAEALLRRVDSFAGDFAFLREADPATAVAWGERRGTAVSLQRTPVEVWPFLAEGRG